MRFDFHMSRRGLELLCAVSLVVNLQSKPVKTSASRVAREEMLVGQPSDVLDVSSEEESKEPSEIERSRNSLFSATFRSIYCNDGPFKRSTCRHLALIDTDAQRFPKTLRHPQLSWIRPECNAEPKIASESVHLSNFKPVFTITCMDRLPAEIHW